VRWRVPSSSSFDIDGDYAVNPRWWRHVRISRSSFFQIPSRQTCAAAPRRKRWIRFRLHRTKAEFRIQGARANKGSVVWHAGAGSGIQVRCHRLSFKERALVASTLSRRYQQYVDSLPPFIAAHARVARVEQLQWCAQAVVQACVRYWCHLRLQPSFSDPFRPLRHAALNDR